MKVSVVLLMGTLFLTACNKDNQGGADNPPVTGRGNGQDGNTGGNGKVYDRGGPPDSANPSMQKPGSGRVDQGGGTTGGGKIDNSISTNANANTNRAGTGNP
jgi:hypothetical protein